MASQPSSDDRIVALLGTIVALLAIVACIGLLFFLHRKNVPVVPAYVTSLKPVRFGPPGRLAGRRGGKKPRTNSAKAAADAAEISADVEAETRGTHEGQPVVGLPVHVCQLRV